VSQLDVEAAKPVPPYRDAATWRGKLMAVQISELFEWSTRLCRLLCGKPLAFRTAGGGAAGQRPRLGLLQAISLIDPPEVAAQVGASAVV